MATDVLRCTPSPQKTAIDSPEKAGKNAEAFTTKAYMKNTTVN